MEGRAPILPSILCISSASRSCSEQKRFLYLTVELLEPYARFAMVVPTGVPPHSSNPNLPLWFSIRASSLRNHFQLLTLRVTRLLTFFGNRDLQIVSTIRKRDAPKPERPAPLFRI